MLIYKPHIIYIGNGEWACGRRLKRKIAGNTAIGWRRYGAGESPANAYAVWARRNKISDPTSGA